MNFYLNGKTVSLKKSLTLAELIISKNLLLETIIAEVNGKALRKEEYNSVPVREGDKIEVLTLVGGG